MILATDRYLIRVGLQSLISHIGVEADFQLVDHLDERFLQQFSEHDYLIVHHNMLHSNHKEQLDIFKKAFKGSVLVICNKLIANSFHPHILNINDGEEKVLETLQNFFSSYDQQENASDDSVLSARETDILKEVALGYSNKEIADKLFISINTVITHRKNLTEKLGIKTISGLTVYAMMNKLINPDEVNI